MQPPGTRHVVPRAECLRNVERSICEATLVVHNVMNYSQLSPTSVPSRCFNLQAADMWSLGVTLFAMVTGRVPWTGGSSAELQRRVLAEPLVFPSRTPLSAPLRHLLSKMLDKDPIRRATLQEIKVLCLVFLFFQKFKGLQDPILKMWGESYHCRTHGPFLYITTQSTDYFL